MKTGRLLSLLLVSCIAVSLTGCGNAEKSSEPNISSAEAESDEMTLKELTESITLCGQKLTYPLTVESLGSDFSLSDIKSSDTGSTADLLYMGDKICVLRFECTPDLVNDSAEASRLIFVPGDEQRKLLSVKGFTAEDTLKDAKKKIGEPTEEKGLTLYYKTSDNGKLEIAGKSEEEIFAVNLYLETGNNI